MPAVGAGWEAEWFEPRNSRPAWATQTVTHSLKTKSLHFNAICKCFMSFVSLLMGSQFLLCYITIPGAEYLQHFDNHDKGLRKLGQVAKRPGNEEEQEILLLFCRTGD